MNAIECLHTKKDELAYDRQEKPPDREVAGGISMRRAQVESVMNVERVSAEGQRDEGPSRFGVGVDEDQD